MGRTSGYIPFDLQIQIIKWLPVKSLIQFRSVCKVWKSLIDSSTFIADHSLHRNQPEHLLVRHMNPETRVDKYVCYVDDDTFPHTSFNPTVPNCVERLVDPIIVGSPQGLLCLYGYNRNPRMEMCVVWNPSIRKSIAIAMPPDAFLHNRHVTVIGFGVCPVTSDPMIVKMTSCYCRKTEVSIKSCYYRKAEVYTLSSRKWRSLSTNLGGKSVEVTWNQVVIDRFIYWFAVEKISKEGDEFVRPLILSFDMANEKFRVIDIPQSLHPLFDPDFDALLSISKLRESLIVFKYTGIVIEKQICGVWMLENGGSFTKLFNVTLPYMSSWDNFLSSWDIMGFRKTGEVVIRKPHFSKDPFGWISLVAYDPNSQHINDLQILAEKGCVFMNSYIETLLLLNV